MSYSEDLIVKRVPMKIREERKKIWIYIFLHCMMLFKKL